MVRKRNILMDVLGIGRIAMDTSPNNWAKKLVQVEIFVDTLEFAIFAMI